MLIEQIIEFESRGLGALVSVHVLQKLGIFMTKQNSPEANLQLNLRVKILQEAMFLAKF